MADDADKSRDYEVTGTWDFKWPIGAEIRVAFQKPPPEMNVSSDEFVEAVKLIMSYAKRWNDSLPPQISFDFLVKSDAFLSPPLGEANSFTDQHRSSFSPETPARVDYDVLVSMADLPSTRVDPFRAYGQEIDNVLFPVSELGSYARRADYGAPTMYLGRFGHARQQSFLDYFKSSLGAHVCVHEFGHALGIPHMHQHPDLILPRKTPFEFSSQLVPYAVLDAARAKFYRPIPEVEQLMKDVLGIDVTPEIVNEHLIEAWRGNLEFSDWVNIDTTVRAEHERAAILDSVMTLPLYRCCTRKHAAADCSRLHDNMIIVAPTPLDRAMLERMYLAPASKETLGPPPNPMALAPAASG